MLMSEYLDTLSEQIRCKKARPMVVEEIRGHIEDQTQAYEKAGMDHAAAMEKAVADMGDPVEAGTALDKIHRPKMQWSMIIMAVALSLFGMLMQIIIFYTGCLSNDSNVMTIRDDYILNAVLYTVIGIAVIIGTCMLDYTFLGKHPLTLWFLICAFSFINFISYENGWGLWFSSYRTAYAMIYYLLTLMLPVFAAVVFSLRRHTFSAFVKCIGLAVLGLLSTGLAYVSAMIEYVLCILIILSVAVLKGWFIPLSDPKAFMKKLLQLAILWIPSIVFPTFIIFSALFWTDSTSLLAPYQSFRIQAMFGLLEDAEYTVNYALTAVRQLLSEASFLGNQELPLTTLPAIQNNYIITSIVTYFGIGAAVVILLLIGWFLCKAFHISLRQKNQLGSIISIACSGALLLKSCIYLCSNLGITMLFSQMSMPFLSFGLMNTIINAVLTGLLLSVFRNTDIISEKMIGPKYRFHFTIQKIKE